MEACYLTINQVSEYIGYAPRTIRKWCECDMLPVLMLIGRKWLIKRESLEKFLRKKELCKWK